MKARRKRGGARRDTAYEGALEAARASRFAAVLLLVGTLATSGIGVATRLLEADSSPTSCTARKIVDLQELREGGYLSRDEFEDLHRDVISDELDDKSSDC